MVRCNIINAMQHKILSAPAAGGTQPHRALRRSGGYPLWAYLGAALLAAAILWLVTWKLALYPAYHGDEVGFLLIPYRFAEFGDMRYPLLFADSFNADFWRKYPPPSALLLTSLVQGAIGFSAYGARLLSVAYMAGAVALPVAILWRLGRPALAMLALVTLGAHPSMVAAARGFRLEQEILFLGSLSLLCALAPLLWPGIRRAAPALWGAAGLCAGLAATSHVWGTIFPAVTLASLLLHARGWREGDGLGTWRRLIFFAAGLAIPALFALWSLLHDWPAVLEYTRKMGLLYAVRHQQLLDYYAPQSTIPFGSLLSKQALVALEMLNRGAFAVDHLPPLGTFAGALRLPFRIVFWIAVAFSAALIPMVWRPNVAAARLPVALLCGLGIAFVVFGLIYPPNTVYFVYATFYVLAGSLVGLGILFPRRLSLLLSSLGAAMGAAFAGVAVVFLATAVSPSKQLGLDTRFAMLATLRDALHIRGNAYCDTLTWMACGRDMRSVVDAVGEDGPFHPTAVVVERDVLDFFAGFMPALSDPLATTHTKVARWRALTKDLALRGVLLDRTSGSVVLAYAEAGQKMLVGIASRDDDVRWYREQEAVGSGKTAEPALFVVPAGDVHDLSALVTAVASAPGLDLLAAPTQDALGLGTNMLIFRARPGVRPPAALQPLIPLKQVDRKQSLLWPSGDHARRAPSSPARHPTGESAAATGARIAGVADNESE